MVILREFTEPVEAGIAQSFLNDSGIDAVLLDEGASAWTAVRGMVPIRLAVPDRQAVEAGELLDYYARTAGEVEEGNLPR